MHWSCVVQARPVTGDEPGELVRYAVAPHLLMGQDEIEVWESLADRCRLEVDDIVHAAALSGLQAQLARDGEAAGTRRSSRSA